MMTQVGPLSVVHLSLCHFIMFEVEWTSKAEMQHNSQEARHASNSTSRFLAEGIVTSASAV